MVFEKLYSTGFLSRRKTMLFVIAFAYSIIGIALAALLFQGQGVSTISLALICLMLLITLKDMIKVTERGDTLHHLGREYVNIMAMLAFVYLGVMMSFLIFSLALPADASSYLFGTQYGFVPGQSASELYTSQNPSPVFLNNASVLLVCLLSSFLFGIETVFLFIVVWNASIMGVTFGIAAKYTAAASAVSPLAVVGIIVFAAAPHIILELLAYLLTGITGENLSKFVMDRKRKLYYSAVKAGLALLAVSVFLVYLGALLEVSWAPGCIDWLLWMIKP